MAQSNPKYHQLDTASAYQRKIESKRKLSGMLEAGMVEHALDDVIGETILDCPCGTGRIDGILRARFPDITGVDSAEAMLEVYKAGHPDRRGRLADVFDLPFADNAFDWVVCHRLFHHFAGDRDRVQLLSSLARVAKNGISLYLWIDVPFSRRGKGREEGRQSLSRSRFEDLLGQTTLVPLRYRYALWPFSPKVIVTLRKR